MQAFCNIISRKFLSTRAWLVGKMLELIVIDELHTGDNLYWFLKKFLVKKRIPLNISNI